LFLKPLDLQEVFLDATIDVRCIPQKPLECRSLRNGSTGYLESSPVRFHSSLIAPDPLKFADLEIDRGQELVRALRRCWVAFTLAILFRALSCFNPTSIYIM
jgi:hypothetical protein